MGSKPKKSDYKPSETEQMQAAIAAADERYFRQTYDPLLVELRDKAATEDVGSTLRGRAQADTYQALTGEGSNYGVAKDIDTAATLAVGATGQLLDANRTAKDVKVTEQVGVLGTARGQAADAGDALAQASKLARSEGLAKAQAKQTVRMAKRKAAFDIGTSLALQGFTNKSQTDSFFRAQSVNLSRDPDNPNSIGYATWGPFRTNRGFNALGKLTPTPKNTTG
jgi:hypothetical protein